MKALVRTFNQEKALVGAFSVIVQPVVEPIDRFAALDNNVSGDGDSYSSYSTSYSLRKHQQPSLFFLLRHTKHHGHTDRKTCITDKVVFRKYVMRSIFFVNILDRLLIQSICRDGQLPCAV